MSQSVLGSITLGYRPVWNRARELAAVQLFIETAQGGAVDAVHLVAALQELSSMATPTLLLSVQSRQLLCDLLDHAPASEHWIEVRSDWLAEPAVAQRVPAAQRRGLQLVWRGGIEAWAQAPLQSSFAKRLMGLSAQTALQALQSAAQQAPGTSGPLTARSPIASGQLYEGVASRALAEHCLDQQDALALVGWPSEDVLHGHRHQPVAPDRRVIMRVAKAVDNDQSMEQIEAIMSEEPVLVYRFLAYVNSAAVGLRTGIESLRHGLMMLGYTSLGKWLVEQLPAAATDLNLHPVKAAMVLRARLTEHLLDAGAEDGLRREIYLCGLFSELDSLLGDPLGVALNRLPLSDRIYSAAVKRTGPYAPALQMARALEGEDTKTIRAVARTHGMQIEDVNRALLRTLVTTPAQQPQPRLR